LSSQYVHNSPYAFSENRVIDGVELEGLEVFLVNGFIPWGPQTPTNAEMKEYWNKKNNFAGVVGKYFKETDIRYESGHRASKFNGGPLSEAATRMRDGYEYMKGELKAGRVVLDNKRPITVVGHSQGNAHGLGMLYAIREFEKDFNANLKEGAEKLNVNLNFVMLAVFQADAEIFKWYLGGKYSDLKVNAIQFSYENDLPRVGVVGSVLDANSEKSNYMVNGEKSSMVTAHSAVIDDTHAFEEIVREDKKTKTFKKKKNEPKN
jgi:hypothetical protein